MCDSYGMPLQWLERINCTQQHITGRQHDVVCKLWCRLARDALAAALASDVQELSHERRSAVAGGCCACIARFGRVA